MMTDSELSLEVYLEVQYCMSYVFIYIFFISVSFKYLFYNSYHSECEFSILARFSR